SVCLVEAGDEIGGAARTLESTLPGFSHDFGSAFFPLISQSPVLAERDFSRFGLEFVHAPLAVAHPIPGEQAVALGATADETAAYIDKVRGNQPGDGDVWRELDRTYGDVVGPFLHAQMVRYPVRDLALL